MQARLTNSTPFPQAAAALHADVLNSAALPIIHENFGSFLLPQAFRRATNASMLPNRPWLGGPRLSYSARVFLDCNQKIRPPLLVAGRDVVEPSRMASH